MKTRHPVMQMRTATCFCVKWAPWRIISSLLNEWTAFTSYVNGNWLQGKGCFSTRLSPTLPVIPFQHIPQFTKVKSFENLNKEKSFPCKCELIVYEHSRYSYYQQKCQTLPGPKISSHQLNMSSNNYDLKPITFKQEYCPKGKGILKWAQEMGVGFMVLTL